MAFGWFSKTQASTFGFAIYKSIDGNTVKISEITDDHRQPARWHDVQYVGEVVDFVANFPIADSYEELSDHDIIESKAMIFTDAKHKNAQADWQSVFVQYGNVRNLFGIGVLMPDKHPPYYGSN